MAVMRYSVEITKVETGEVRTISIPFDWEEDYSLWLWTEGNYGCDCNRELFFDNKQPGYIPEKCGNTRFKARAILADGRQIELD